MKAILKKEILKLKNKKHVDQNVLQKFLKRLQSGKGLLRYENIADHFCVFFLPIHHKSSSIYLGHHIKADDWIPPGGHIEKGEHPVDTIKREIVEELDYELGDELIEIFDLTIKPIRRKHPCKLHWDLWYLIYLKEKIPFKFEKREFYNAGWFELERAVEKIKGNNYRKTIEKLLIY